MTKQPRAKKPTTKQPRAKQPKKPQPAHPAIFETVDHPGARQLRRKNHIKKCPSLSLRCSRRPTPAYYLRYLKRCRTNTKPFDK
ncbi:hypothetical protein L596_020597 [Steinernema carpocapsae]|uniref:Uncharacterized protein n=1 Tax=Steinernema carpocapsae TaxID=34508 RepID=A0A4U5MU73_STECR|nr:hypothetical protein L596_020597 [Steinernema carpocapsae]